MNLLNPYELLFEVDLDLDTYNNQIKNNIEEIYCYMNHNTRTIQVYANDEQKIKLNVMKILHKHTGIKPKNFFDVVQDVRLVMDTDKNILKINYYKET
jgi:hypothetical protein